MRDILPDIQRWRQAGEPIALATVVETWGSAPRRPGAKMAITPAGGIAGSVSGGCVEAAVFEAGVDVVRSGRPRLLRFGVTDENAWAVGLACGGTISVFVERLDEAIFDPLRVAIRDGRPAAVATVVEGTEELLGRKILMGTDGSVTGTLSGDTAERAAHAARDALEHGATARVDLPAEEGRESFAVFVEVLEPAPRLVIVGGVHIAVTLTAIARALGYRTVVVDPRRAFGNETRFPHADELLSEWPDAALRGLSLDASTAVAVLTHDPKLDDPALAAALSSDAFYVGALGSLATQEKRRRRLVEAGLSEERLARLHAPIGLDLGGRSPEEIALSVMAEIVAEHNRR